MKRINGIYRRRVMIGTLGAFTPIAHDQIHIQEPTLHLTLSRGDHLHCIGTKGNGCDTWQTGKAFLRARVHNISTPGIHLQIDSRQ